jgi:hypothetical protein
MTTLAASDLARLTRLLGMLGSSHVGEVANAGRLADKMVRAAGLTWPDIITPTLAPPPPDQDADPIGADWRRTAASCRRYPHLLNGWEAAFLSGLPRFPRLSCKQRAILLKIAVRLRTCGCSL